MTNIVVISGKICAGKSSVARGVTLIDPRYEVVSLASPLKNDVVSMTGQPITRDNKHIVRELLQAYGSSMKGLYGQNYWAERLLDYARDMNIENFIVDDVRYPYELEALKEYADSFYSIRLLIHPQLQQERYQALYGRELDETKLGHHSETSLDEYVDFDTLMDAATPFEWQVRLVAEGMERRGMLEGEPLTLVTVEQANEKV